MKVPPLIKNALRLAGFLAGACVLETLLGEQLQRSQGLIVHIESQPEEIRNALDVLSDLGFIRDALTAAPERAARFCFLLRIGDSWSHAEMDVRDGYFSDEWKSRDHLVAGKVVAVQVSAICHCDCSKTL